MAHTCGQNEHQTREASIARIYEGAVRGCIRLGAVLISTGTLVSCNKSQAPQQGGGGPAAPPEERVEKNPDRNAYFGEEHIHTSWSVDAWLMGNRITGPDEALKYGQGQTIKHPLGATRLTGDLAANWSHSPW